VAPHSQAVHNLAGECVDALRIRRAGYSHLEHNRPGWRERCRVAGHLSSAVLALAKGPQVAPICSGFTFVSGFNLRFRLPDALARLECSKAAQESYRLKKTITLRTPLL
jgi:hypothetical protein